MYNCAQNNMYNTYIVIYIARSGFRVQVGTLTYLFVLNLAVGK